MRLIAAFVLGAVVLVACAGASGARDAARPLPAGSWRLVYDEGFGGRLDGWRPCVYWGCSDRGELQQYTPANARTAGGVLTLTARSRDASGSRYTSGELSSDTPSGFSFRYGYVEARIRFARGSGLLGALWMLPKSHNDDAGEIDVAEGRGDQPGRVYLTYHRGDASHQCSYDAAGLGRGWHRFGVEWSAGSLAWYVDGVRRCRYSGGDVLDQPAYLILSLAVGGSWVGPPQSTTGFPASMRVDYVRVWQRS